MPVDNETEGLRNLQARLSWEEAPAFTHPGQGACPSMRAVCAAQSSPPGSSKGVIAKRILRRGADTGASIYTRNGARAGFNLNSFIVELFLRSLSRLANRAPKFLGALKTAKSVADCGLYHRGTAAVHAQHNAIAECHFGSRERELCSEIRKFSFARTDFAEKSMGFPYYNVSGDHLTAWYSATGVLAGAELPMSVDQGLRRHESIPLKPQAW